MAPIQVVADSGSADRLAQRLAALPGVAGVSEAVRSRDGHNVLIVVTPKTAAEDNATYALIDRA